MRKYRQLSMLFAIGALLAPAAHAQQCAGFDDVAQASAFCPNVQWLKNRAITLGCTGTSYCPNDLVVRLSMAAFMNRLGKALSPEVLFEEHGNSLAFPVPDSPPSTTRCNTIDTAAAAYPRKAMLTGTLSGLADTNTVAWRGSLLYSTDAGSTWTGTTASIALRASSAAGLWSSVDPNGAIDLAPGLTYRFAIGVLRDDVLTGTTGNFVNFRCLLTVAIFNQTGVSAPFDVGGNATGEGL